MVGPSVRPASQDLERDRSERGEEVREQEVTSLDCLASR